MDVATETLTNEPISELIIPHKWTKCDNYKYKITEPIIRNDSIIQSSSTTDNETKQLPNNKFSNFDTLTTDLLMIKTKNNDPVTDIIDTIDEDMNIPTETPTNKNSVTRDSTANEETQEKYWYLYCLALKE